jgi:hypothetical protein
MRPPRISPLLLHMHLQTLLSLVLLLRHAVARCAICTPLQKPLLRNPDAMMLYAAWRWSSTWTTRLDSFVHVRSLSRWASPLAHLPSPISFAHALNSREATCSSRLLQEHPWHTSVPYSPPKIYLASFLPALTPSRNTLILPSSCNSSRRIALPPTRARGSARHTRTTSLWCRRRRPVGSRPRHAA